MADALAPLGDLDGDGVDDLVAGAPGDIRQGVNAGAVMFVSTGAVIEASGD